MNFQPLTNNPQPSVRLHIERLVVDGALLAGGGSGLQTAIENELARLLAERGLVPDASAAIPNMTARNIQVGSTARPAQLGRQIANAVYTTIGAANAPSGNGQPIGGSR